MPWRLRVIQSQTWVINEKNKPVEYPTKKAAKEDLNACFIHPRSYEIVDYVPKIKKKAKKKKTSKRKR